MTASSSAAPRFFVVPQWQGSPSARALRLADGALAISGDLPAASTTIVEVPPEAGDEQGTGVGRHSAILAVRTSMTDALAKHRGPAITIGGDCGVELAAVEHALNDDVAVVWFDAHPDLNTPQSSPSGAFAGMVLRTLLGNGPEHLLPSVALRADRVVLVGAREVDPGEASYIAEAGIRSLPVLGLTPEAIVAAVENSGATSVYVHVDLDVLDPGVLAGVANPVPFGLQAAELVDLVRALTRSFTLAGAGIAQFAPVSREQADDDLPTVLRLIGALTAPRT